MKKSIFNYFALVGIFALLVVLLDLPGTSWAISGGVPDGNQHPNVGAIIAYLPEVGIVPICSGTLIDERVFLTAGHCTAVIEDGEVTLLGVTFDANIVAGNPMDPNTWFDSAVVREISGYGRFEGANPNRLDIGVLILKEPVTNITPAALPEAGLLDDLKKTQQLKSGPNGTQLTVVGYGWDLVFPPPNQVWDSQFVEVEYNGQTMMFAGGLRNTAQSGFLSLNKAWLGLNQNLAAGYGGTQSGDSGGPVFWTDPDTGQEVLVSITSWGGSLIGNGWYYRIDTEESLNFIQDAIDGLED